MAYTYTMNACKPPQRMQYLPPPPSHLYPPPSGPPSPYHPSNSPLQQHQQPYQQQPHRTPSPQPQPQHNLPPPPMRITGPLILNALTNQPIYTTSYSRAPASKRDASLLTLIHLPTGSVIGQARRHLTSSSIVHIGASSSPLKKEHGALSDRWAYTPMFDNGARWYFKNPRKLDFRLLDEKHGGRELLAIKGEELTFSMGSLGPGAVGELVLACMVLRADVAEEKKIGDAVGEAVVEASFA